MVEAEVDERRGKFPIFLITILGSAPREEKDIFVSVFENFLIEFILIPSVVIGSIVIPLIIFIIAGYLGIPPLVTKILMVVFVVGILILVVLFLLKRA